MQSTSTCPISLLFLAALCGALLAAPLSAASASAAGSASSAGSGTGAKIETNKPALAVLQACATALGVKLTELDGGPVRLVMFGGSAPSQAKEILDAAVQSLQGLEVWTGNNQRFYKPGQGDERDLCLCLLADDALYPKLVGELRKLGVMKPPPGNGQVDVLLKVSGFPLQRVIVAKPVMLQSHKHWAAYSTAVLALDSAWREGGGTDRTPSWFREGAACEMQRLQYHNTVRMTTISYELRTDPDMHDWPAWVARIAQEASQGNAASMKIVMKASDVLNAELDAMSGANYRQLWSFFTYVQQQCGAVQGKNNKLLQIFDALLSEPSGSHALIKVLKAKDPQLTINWLSWAMVNARLPSGP